MKKYLGESGVILVTSFNEWYEDTQIEPYETISIGDDYDSSPNYGNKFLKLIKSFKNI
jgi:hypothetical protein